MCTKTCKLNTTLSICLIDGRGSSALGPVCWITLGYHNIPEYEGIIDFRKPDVNAFTNIARYFPPFLLHICLLFVGIVLIELIKLWLPQHLPGKLNSMKNYADQHRELYPCFVP